MNLNLMVFNLNNRTYVINLEEYELIRTHWIALYVNSNSFIYFDSFGVEHIQKKFKKSLETKI